MKAKLIADPDNYCRIQISVVLDNFYKNILMSIEKDLNIEKMLIGYMVERINYWMNSLEYLKDPDSKIIERKIWISSTSRPNK